MKKLAILAVLFALTACAGVRGTTGGQKTCENQSFMGISIIEALSPCNGGKVVDWGK